MAPSQYQKEEITRLKKKIDINEDIERKPRRKKIKGVNPLAMKKKKNKTISVAGKQVDRNEKVEQIYYIYFLLHFLAALSPRSPFLFTFLRPVYPNYFFTAQLVENISFISLLSKASGLQLY